MSRICPLCDKEGLKWLPNHLARFHKLTSADRKPWIKIARYDSQHVTSARKSRKVVIPRSRSILQPLELKYTKCEEAIQHNSDNVEERRTYTDHELVQRELSRFARTIHSYHQQRNRKLCNICQQYRKHVAQTLKNYETL